MTAAIVTHAYGCECGACEDAQHEALLVRTTKDATARAIAHWIRTEWGAPAIADSVEREWCRRT